MGWSADDVGDLTGRRVLVTGGNSGVGLEAARVLAAHGADVVLAVRDVTRGERARDTITGGAERVEVQQLDLADLDSVAGCARRLVDAARPLDVLLLNAGVMGGPRQATAQGLERQMGTNHLGHFALTARLWPLVTAAAAPRVVVVSSLAARGGRLGADMSVDDLVDPQPYRSGVVYANTKQANLLFAQELHRRGGPGVTAVAVHPGVAWTELFPRQMREDGRAWLLPLVQLARPVVFQSAGAGALPSVRAACDPQVRGGQFVGPTTFFGARGAPKVIELFAPGRDPATARRLWELSEQVTGTPFPL